MKLADFNRLKHLMQMTRSDNDTEALTAVRKANELLAASGVDWERVFARLVQVEGPAVEADPELSRKDPSEAGSRRYLEDLLTDAEGNASGDFVDFVASLREQFDRTGRLSPLQVQALEKSKARREERGGRERRARRWS